MTIDYIKSLERHDWLGLFITAVISIAGTLAVMRSDTLGHEASIQKVAFERVAHLEKRIDELRGALNKQHAVVAALQAQLAAKPDPLGALFAYIEAIDAPAWLKLYEPDSKQFYMLYINAEYELVYNGRRVRYIGQTDFDIHEASRAQQYYENDLHIIEKKDFLAFTEMGLSRESGQAGYGPARFWKFYVKLPDGRELVAGVQVGNPELVN